MLSEKDDSLEAVVEVSESRPQTIARLIYGQNKVSRSQVIANFYLSSDLSILVLLNHVSECLLLLSLFYFNLLDGDETWADYVGRLST